jgi:hypothetical protein
MATAHRAQAARGAALWRLVRPLAEERTYRNGLYVLLGFPLGLAYFVFLSAGLSFASGLVVTLVGIPMLYAMMLAWRGLGELERALARGCCVLTSPRRRRPPGARLGRDCARG